MTDFRRVTDAFYVAPQITEQDVERAAKDGFTALIMNRPDGEEPGQPATSLISGTAEKLGMSFCHIPITAPPQQADIVATAEALKASEGQKVLAFCRSGTRSVTLWAYAQVALGQLSVSDALNAAAQAGYDLSGHRAILERISG